MPLTNYGVLLGTKAAYSRGTPNQQGRYTRAHVAVQTPAGLFNAAIDVGVQAAGLQIERRVVPLRVAEWSKIFALSDGYHALASNAASGATDYVRDPRLMNLFIIPERMETTRPWWSLGRRELWSFLFGDPRDSVGPTPLNPWVALAGSDATSMVSELESAPEAEAAGGRPSEPTARRRAITFDATPPWQSGSDLETLADLESMLLDARRVVVFGQMDLAQNGEPSGLHNIHQNQRDPAGSAWYPDNGSWQDGLTIAVYADGTASAFVNKFSTQAWRLDPQAQPRRSAVPAAPETFFESNVVA